MAHHLYRFWLEDSGLSLLLSGVRAISGSTTAFTLMGALVAVTLVVRWSPRRRSSVSCFRPFSLQG